MFRTQAQFPRGGKIRSAGAAGKVQDQRPPGQAAQLGRPQHRGRYGVDDRIKVRQKLFQRGQRCGMQPRAARCGPLFRRAGFKGYIHDVGGPTANFRRPSCQGQLTKGLCKGKKCLAPQPCPALRADHSEYLHLLRRLRKLPGIKKVFIRSGIRFDYLLADPDESFFKELVEHHISGQLKVAPEHCSAPVLSCMGKPPIDTYRRFQKRFYELTKSAGKKQYLVPYLMSSHPGSTMRDAIELSVFLKREGLHPEQVQDFYPTPGTVSTCMFYTGLDPYTLKPVYVPRTPREKAEQRALLQYFRPENRPLVLAALKKAGRFDLIGTGPDCLAAPETGKAPASRPGGAPRRKTPAKRKPPRRRS